MSMKPIHGKAEYEAVLTEIDGLMNAVPGTPEGERLDSLTSLVEAYEARRFPIDAASDDTGFPDRKQTDRTGH